MDEKPPRNRLKQVRTLLWLLVAITLVGIAALLLLRRDDADPPQVRTATTASLGGAFTLVDADRKPFSSEQLQGKPYLIFFGFTRCGDVCPTTLSRLVKLRREAASDQALNIVFVTIDPKNDGPKEVGQYATLFDAPIIGLTGSQAQISHVKKQYGIHAEPVAHAPAGKEMEHTSTVLLFDRSGNLVAAISQSEPDSSALAKIRQVVA
jgi:protein SCO1